MLFAKKVILELKIPCPLRDSWNLILKRTKILQRYARKGRLASVSPSKVKRTNARGVFSSDRMSNDLCNVRSKLSLIQRPCMLRPLSRDV